MKVLNEAQKAFFESEGYLLLPGLVSDEWLDKLNAATDRFIEQSRSLTESSSRILVEPSHEPDAPRLRRITHTVSADPDYEAFGLRGPLLDLAEDLLGPNIRFHHSKLNFKWHSGGEAVEWHQDIQFWPHTNYGPITIGVYLTDVTDEMGPMGIVPKSHRGELFHLADEDGNWTGSISDTDLARLNLDDVAWLTGPRGSVTVHSCRSVHGSRPNRSEQIRPLLLHTYAPAHAHTTTNLVEGTPLANQMVRGVEMDAVHEGEPCPMPPDFKGGYKSIFSVQKKETA